MDCVRVHGVYGLWISLCAQLAHWEVVHIDYVCVCVCGHIHVSLCVRVLVCVCVLILIGIIFNIS